MNESESKRAVADQARVRLRYGTGEAFAEGRVLSYSMVPTVCIETDDGRRIHWRHDLAERVDDGDHDWPLHKRLIAARWASRRGTSEES